MANKTNTRIQSLLDAQPWMTRQQVERLYEKFMFIAEFTFNLSGDAYHHFMDRNFEEACQGDRKGIECVLRELGIA